MWAQTSPPLPLAGLPDKPWQMLLHSAPGLLCFLQLSEAQNQPPPTAHLRPPPPQGLKRQKREEEEEPSSFEHSHLPSPLKRARHQQVGACMAMCQVQEHPSSLGRSHLPFCPREDLRLAGGRLQQDACRWSASFERSAGLIA